MSASAPRKSPPAFARAMEAIACVPMDAAERAACLAAVRWADARGVLYPSIPTWANMAGVKERTLQRALRRLSTRGVVVVVKASRGGVGRSGRGITSHYRLNIPGWTRPEPTENPDVLTGLPASPSDGEPRRPVPGTPTTATGNPDLDDVQPRPSDGGRASEEPMNQPPQPPGGGGGCVLDLIERLRKEHP